MSVCCCALQCVAVVCNVHTFMYVSHADRGNTAFMNNYRGELQCVAVLQRVAVCCNVVQCVVVCCSVLQCAAVCCSVLQCVAVCCSLLQYVVECIHSCGCHTQIMELGANSTLHS